jgi:hypothetical protein
VRWSPAIPARDAILKALFISSDGTTASIATGSVGRGAADRAVPRLRLRAVGADPQRLDDPGGRLARDRHRPALRVRLQAGLPEPMAINGAGSNGKLAITLKADVGDLDLGAGTGAVLGGVHPLRLGRRLRHRHGDGDPQHQLVERGGDRRRERPADDARGCCAAPVHNGTTKPLTWATA